MTAGAAPASTAPRGAVVFILITVLIDTIGFGLIVPVIPALLMELTGEGLSQAAVYGGWLLFLFAALQFVTAPILGSLSDRYGRRPVLLIALAAFSVDFAIMGWAPTLAWLFVGRALSGIFGATHAVASAYVADVTSPDKRARSFGLLGAAWGVGFVLGPALGGLLGDSNPRLPFYVAAALAALNVLYGYFVLPESLAAENRRPFRLRRANPLGAFRQVVRYPLVPGLLAASFLFALAHDANPTTWSYFTMEKFGWTARDVGLSMSFIGVMAAIVQAGLIGPAVRLLGERRAVWIGYTLFASGFLGYAFAPTSLVLYLWTIPFCLGSIAGPAVNALMSKQVPANAQGELQGALSSMRSITACLGPPLMTGLFSYFTAPAAPVQFPGASFAAAGVLTFGALAIALTVLRTRLT